MAAVRAGSGGSRKGQEEILRPRAEEAGELERRGQNGAEPRQDVDQQRPPRAHGSWPARVGAGRDCGGRRRGALIDIEKGAKYLRLRRAALEFKSVDGAGGAAGPR